MVRDAGTDCRRHARTGEVMTHVRQKDPNGCVVACLAMITGLTYDEVNAEFTGDRIKDGLSFFSYDPWLAYKGFAVARIYRHYSPQRADRATWPPPPFADVHLVTVVYTQGHHAIIWLRDGTVLDPMKDGPCTLEGYDVQSVTGVYKFGEGPSVGPLIYNHWSGADQKCIWCGAHIDTYKHHDPCPARN